jgi:hypothetical protein
VIDRRTLLRAGGLAVVGVALAACDANNGKWPTWKSSTDDEDPCAGVDKHDPDTWKYRVKIPQAHGGARGVTIIGRAEARAWNKKHPAHKVIRYC